MTQPAFRLMLVGLISVMLLSALDHTVVVTALPLISERLGSQEGITWIVTGYMLASSLSAMWFGQIADIIGTKLALQVAVILFVVGSALCGLAHDMTQLVLLRVLQGIGAGGLMTLSQTVIARVVVPRERGRYQGYVMSAFAGASLAGPLLGGLIADNISWRAIFLVNVPVGVVALFLLQRTVPSRPAEERAARLEAPWSLMLVSVGAGGALLGVSRLGEASALDQVSLAASGFAAVAIALLVLVERRASTPLFGSPAVASRTFVLSNAASVLVHAAMMGAVVLLPLYLHDVRGYSVAMTGVIMLPQVFGWLVATLACGVLISRSGRYRRFAVIGCALTAGGLAAVGSLGASSSLWFVGAALAGFGIGQGLALQSLLVAVQAAVPRDELGKATGLASFARSCGSVFGVALSGVMLAQLRASGVDLAEALRWTLLASAPIAIGAFVCSWTMGETHLQTREEHARDAGVAGVSTDASLDASMDTTVGNSAPTPVGAEQLHRGRVS